MKKILLILLVVISHMALAGHYRPYTQANNDFHVKTTLHERFFKTIKHRKTTLKFFTPIAENIENIFSRKAWVKTPEFCFGEKFPPRSNCTSLIENWNDQTTCLEGEFPEVQYRTNDLSRFNKKDLDSIEGIHRIALGPLFHLDMPSFLFGEKTYGQWREAYWRLQYPQNIKRLKDRLKELKSTEDELLNCYDQNDQSSVKGLIVNKYRAIENIQSHIESVASRGMEIIVQENKKLQALGHCPHAYKEGPLTRDDRALLSAVVGGLTWRMRGGGIWHMPETNLYRKLFGERPFITLVNFNAPGIPKTAHYIGGAMLDRLKLKGWNEWFDMGRYAGTEMDDLHGMTKRGHYQVGHGSYYGPIAGRSATYALGKIGYDASALQIGGLQMGACYYIAQYGLHTPDFYYGVHWQPPLVAFTYTAITWGELCAGAAMGMGLSYSLTSGPVCDAD